MRKFLVGLFKFSLIGLIPFLILCSLYVVWDPFKVIYTYDLFYEPNAQGKIELNRGHISTTTFINNSRNLNIHYDSYIFGNSRSIVYQVSEWKKHLCPESTCYHFDAAGEALWALNKRVEFVDKEGAEIKNALLVIDNTTLAQDKPKSGHLFIISPILVENSNFVDFHWTFFRAFISPTFIYAWLDHRITGKVKCKLPRSSAGHSCV